MDKNGQKRDVSGGAAGSVEIKSKQDLKKTRLTTDGNSVTIQSMGKKQPQRPAKNPDILKIAQAALASGNFTPVDHAKVRLNQREVTIAEVKQVVEGGYRELKKDEFKKEHNAWNYSIRGKTVDKRSLRIAVSLDKSGLLIITVIDLDKKDG
jgi:hypothetical protein